MKQPFIAKLGPHPNDPTVTLSVRRTRAERQVADLRVTYGAQVELIDPNVGVLAHAEANKQLEART